MEGSRICLSRNSKQQQSNNSAQSIQEMNVYKFKGKWEFCHEFKNNNKNNAEDNRVGTGFSWPPRCYSCSFCRREFRSAQALGGHMNVHRRDRARLRQFSPPKINQNLDPNPSFMSSHWTRFPHYTSPLPPFFPSNSHSHLSSCLDSNHAGFVRSTVEGALFENLKPSAGDLMKMETQNAFNSVEKLGSLVCEKGYENIVKKDLVRLDQQLEIGLISQYSHGELDLELRLGYTSRNSL